MPISIQNKCLIVENHNKLRSDMTSNEGLRRQMIREFLEMRREMAGEAFVHYRESFGEYTTFLRLKVLVPICPDCWFDQPGVTSGVPNITSDNWELDLLLLGFDPNVIEKLKDDIDAGIEPERGPWCHVCGEWLPWWEIEDGCYTKIVDFADYFWFEEKEQPSVRKRMRDRITKMYGRKCFACGRTLSDSEITIDHIVARSRGGKGDQVNLQVLYEVCNKEKGDSEAEVKEAILHFPTRPVPSDAYEGVTW